MKARRIVAMLMMCVLLTNVLNIRILAKDSNENIWNNNIPIFFEYL